MALAEAILTCLTEQPMSGYDLAKKFDTSIGFFWKADHQQIYRELARLRETGLVAGTEVPRPGKPTSVVHSITEMGRARLRDWSRVSTEPPTLKENLLVKFYGLQSIDLVALIEDVASRLLRHEQRHALYEKILERRYAGRELGRAEIGKLAGLNFGLAYERLWIDWCRQTGEMLASLAGDSSKGG